MRVHANFVEQLAVEKGIKLRRNPTALDSCVGHHLACAENVGLVGLNVPCSTLR